MLTIDKSELIERLSNLDPSVEYFKYSIEKDKYIGNGPLGRKTFTVAELIEQMPKFLPEYIADTVLFPQDEDGYPNTYLPAFSGVEEVQPVLDHLNRLVVETTDCDTVTFAIAYDPASPEGDRTVYLDIEVDNVGVQNIKQVRDISH